MYLLLSFLACAPPVEKPTPEASSRVRKVLLVGVDGVRPDALLAADTPALDALLPEAAWSFAATTQLTADTVSAPGWMSVLTGVDPDKHGVFANGSYGTRSAAWPTLLKVAHDDLGLTTAVIAEWVEMAVIVEPGTADTMILALDDEGAPMMADRLNNDDDDVSFMYLVDTDDAGHTSGFDPGNPDYIAEIEDVDRQLGTLLDAVHSRPTYADEDWLIVLVTDHGGTWDGHGPRTPENQTIWLVVAGGGVTPGEIAGTPTQMDAGATILDFLGAEPADLDGGVVR